MVLSAAAFFVSLVGVTPADAVNTVRRALFAKNAGAVDGISASRTPRPGMLLPLDASGKLPTRALPQGARGERGPRGPEGQAGPMSPIEVLTTKGRSTALPLAGFEALDVSALPVGAGTWLVMASGSVVWDPAAGSIYVQCDLSVAGRAAGSTGRLGSEAGAALASPFSIHVLATAASPTTARVSCFHDQNISGSLRAQDVRITAVRVDRFSERPGDGT